MPLKQQFMFVKKHPVSTAVYYAFLLQQFCPVTKTIAAKVGDYGKAEDGNGAGQDFGIRQK